MSAAPRRIGATDLSLLLLTCRGTRVYFLYLVRPEDVDDAISDIDAEIRALDDQITIGTLSPHNAARLLREWPSRRVDEVLLIGAELFTDKDWMLLDRRRSDLAREGPTVLLTTDSAFDALMQVAPNLASWLGALVFSREDPAERLAALREQRLASLRARSEMTDEEVVGAAQAGTLPRDPEYAEWLVLLGRGDLLDAG
jgi:hypothetical protein